jgi:hypothetical protein
MFGKVFATLVAAMVCLPAAASAKNGPVVVVATIEAN